MTIVKYAIYFHILNTKVSWILGFSYFFTSTKHRVTSEVSSLSFIIYSGFPLNLENLEKWGYTWKTWKYHGILKNLINIMEKWHETWKNLVATKNSPLTPLKQYKIH